MSFSINAITSQGAGSISKSDLNSKLKNLGIPEEVISQGESAIQQYASENNITLPSAQKKQESSSVFQKQNQNQPSQGQIEQELSTLGIPVEIIAQGPSAVKKYASENNITLPEPPKNSRPDGAGQQLDLMG